MWTEDNRTGNVLSIVNVRETDTPVNIGEGSIQSCSLIASGQENDENQEKITGNCAAIYKQPCYFQSVIKKNLDFLYQ
jgi:hypothetical protein